MLTVNNWSVTYLGC